MTVDITNVYNVYTVTRPEPGEVYPITFPFISPEYVKCYYAVDKEQTDMVFGRDYTVNSEAGELTVAGSIPVDAKLVIYRVTDLTQEIDWVDGQSVYTPDIEQADDKLTHIVQELAEQTNRSVKITREEEASGVNPEYRYNEIEQAHKETLEARDQAVAAAAEIGPSKDSALVEIATAKDNAVHNVNDVRATAVVNIATKETEALSAIDGAKTAAVGAVTGTQSTAVTAVNEAASTAISQTQAHVNEAKQAKESAQIASNQAQTFALAASQKADAILNLTAEAQTLEVGEAVTVSYDPSVPKMTFGIPRGERGPKGEDGQRGPIGPQGQAPYVDVISCGGACGTWLTTINAGAACTQF